MCFLLAIMLSISGCTSIDEVGSLGPQHLKVYSVAKNDMLSASRMLVILDKKGNVAAYTGGTVAGAGTVSVEAGAQILTAGAIYYGARSMQHGLTNANVKGVPSNLNVDVTPHLPKK